MNPPGSDPKARLAAASEARQQGRSGDARALLTALTADYPRLGPAWNMLGLVEIDGGDPARAETSFRMAVDADPAAPPPWFNLSRAQRALGRRDDELASLEQALSRDPFFLPAVLAKGETLLALGRHGDALELYRLLFAGLPADLKVPEGLAQQLAAARALLDRHGARQLDQFAAAIAQVATSHPDADLHRARAFAEQRAGKRQIYQQRPTDGHFPFLPAIEYFSRDSFPWFGELEASTALIRSELLNLWAEENADFRPYVTYEAGVPVGDWAELNWSPRWSAFFLWENGVRNEANCARCPGTAAAIDRLPLLDIPGKSPTVMFSILQPRTRIPPHTGSSNIRTTIHLPLVVPPGCGFRVGAETREWKEGECWAFDDTIEHEAWNNSDQVRAILILDGWNPLLTEAERAVARMIG
nr:aspartyl/asparaginyl beta-hydroxylase domain-containing protein [uncultured Sphingomonas sp.]